MNISCYNSIPQNAFAYWASTNLVRNYSKFKAVKEYVEPKKGLSTGNNDMFLKIWFEVDFKNISFNSTDYINAFAYGTRWFPINKGGSFRKWYGNNEYVVDYKDNGKSLKKFSGSVIRNENYYFNESLTWSMLSSTTLGIRFSNKGKIFEGAGPSLFVEKDINYFLGFLSSKIAIYFIKTLNPTLNINIADVGNIPIAYDDDAEIKKVSKMSENNISLSKSDWDSFETSWDFKKHPLI